MIIFISSFAIQELRMCKTIRHVYYCEELFLIKHRTHPTCESAIFYNTPPTIVYSVCTFKYFYNITVQPSILDGGNHILLANQKAAKNLICSHNHNLAMPLAPVPLCISQQIPAMSLLTSIWHDSFWPSPWPHVKMPPV